MIQDHVIALVHNRKPVRTGARKISWQRTRKLSQSHGQSLSGNGERRRERRRERVTLDVGIYLGADVTGSARSIGAVKNKNGGTNIGKEFELRVIFDISIPKSVSFVAEGKARRI